MLAQNYCKAIKNFLAPESRFRKTAPVIVRGLSASYQAMESEKTCSKYKIIREKKYHFKINISTLLRHLP